MKVLSLQDDNGYALCNLKNQACGDVNLVFGDNAKDLLNSAHDSLREDVLDMRAYDHAVGGMNQIGHTDKTLSEHWAFIQDNPVALNLLTGFLKTIEPRFEDLKLGDFGRLNVGLSPSLGWYWKDINEISEELTFAIKVGLLAFSAGYGLVMFYNIEKVGLSNIEALTNYFMDIGALHNNRTVLSTNCELCAKAFGKVAAERNDIDSAYITVEPSKADDYDYYC